MSKPNVEQDQQDQQEETSPPPDFGPQPQLSKLPVGSLTVDDRYQRKVSRRGVGLIKRIAKDFFWPYFGLITVTDNGDGTYCIIDGQHRVAAARLVEGIRLVPCVILEGLTFKEQAATFCKINANRISLSPLQIYQAQLKAGDSEAVKLCASLKKHGLEIAKNTMPPHLQADGQVSCPGNLLRLQKHSSPHRFNQTLQIVSTAFERRTIDLKTFIFMAVYRCLRAGCSEEALISILGTHAADEWKTLAQRDFFETNSVAEALKLKLCVHLGVKIEEDAE